MADSSTSSTVQSGEPAAIVRKGVAIAGIQVSVKKGAHIHVTGDRVGDGVGRNGDGSRYPETRDAGGHGGHDQRRRRKGRGEGCVRVFRGDAEGP